MIKRTLVFFGFIILFMLGHPVFAAEGNLFQVTAIGQPVPAYSVNLCLNAKGSISCQDIYVSAFNLSIQSTIPNQTYPMAGMKINSATYSIANCSKVNNYCQFSVSDTQAISMTVFPSNQPYSLGGSISGLTSSGLVLQNNGANNLSISPNSSSFSFPYATGSGISYDVTILTQPVRQLCSLSNGSGSGATENITNISITCTSIPLAYISNYKQSTQLLSNISYCPLNASGDQNNGSFQTCTETPSISPDWVPYGVAFATINSTQYAYVVSNRGNGSGGGSRGIYLCGIIPGTGAFTGAFGSDSCSLIDTTTSAPTGITVATIGETQYLYYTDNVAHHADVCTINSSDGTLNCNSAITGTPPEVNSNAWAPYVPTIATINGTSYAFIADWANSVIWQCTIQADGTFIQNNTNMCTSYQFTWSPYGVTVATVDGIASVYVASRNDKTLYQCPIQLSAIDPTNCNAFTLSNWSPTGVSIAIVNEVPYAYVSSPYTNLSASPPVYPSVYQCAFSGLGQVSSCSVVSTSSSLNWTPYNITMQTIISG